MDLLKVEKREIIGKKVKNLRKEGIIPAVIYGAGTENINLAVDYIFFEKTYSKVGESTLINLQLKDEDDIPVLIHSVFYNPVSDKIDHVDFYRVNYGEKLTATVELDFIGEPKAVKELGGVLFTSLQEVEIECLPKDLIGKIKVDLTKLETFESYIHIKDLEVPETIKILTGADDVVANVARPRIAEEKSKVIEEENTDDQKEEEPKEESKDGEKKEKNNSK